MQTDTESNGTKAKKAPTKKKTTKKKKGEEQVIEIPKLQLLDVMVTVVSDSPLIIHRFSDKAKKEMLDKQMGKAKMKKKPKDPVQDFLDSFYVAGGKHGARPEAYEDEDGEMAAKAIDPFVFPSLAFKNAMVGACRHVDGMTMTATKGAFHVLGEFVEILYNEDPIMREDVVRIGGAAKTADLRYRGEFENWSVKLPIRYNERSISLDQLINLINIAGFSAGIGEWRPERDGNYGMFHVDLDAQVDTSADS